MRSDIPKQLTFEKPAEDETLLAFCFRASQDAYLDWSDVQRVLFGVRFISSRPSELRFFDWAALAEKLGLPEDDVYSRTERAWYASKEDRVQLTGQKLAFAPWAYDQGYPCYNPAAFQTGFHWRRTWLLPGQIDDPHTGTLMLLHCPSCGARTREVRWAMPYPECSCGHHLFEAPVIPTPSNLKPVAEKLRRILHHVFGSGPAYLLSEEAIRLTAMWYVVRALEQHKLPRKLYHFLASEADVGAYKHPIEGRPLDIEAEAIRHAQLWAAAEVACARDSVVRRYRQLLSIAKTTRQCGPAIERGLAEFANTL